MQKKYILVDRRVVDVKSDKALKTEALSFDEMLEHIECNVKKENFLMYYVYEANKKGKIAKKYWSIDEILRMKKAIELFG